MNDLIGPPCPDATHLRIDALRREGAQRFNPVQFRFIESLAQRLHHHRGSVREQLAGRTQDALDRYCEDFEQAKARARQLAEHTAEEHQDCPQEPAHALLQEVQLHLQSHQFTALERTVRRLRQSHQANSENRRALAALTNQLNGENSHGDKASATSLSQRLRQQENAVNHSISTRHSHPAGELKSIVDFRDSWNGMRRRQLVEDSVTQGPRDAGPLNPERLAIRSLSAMQELSPQYLNRFVSYVETLLWLQQIDSRQQSASRKKTPKK